MILEGFTFQELSGMHLTAGEFASRMYATTIRITYEMGTITDRETYDARKAVREVAFAAAREAEELMVEIGAEMKARDYRDTPDGH